MPLPKSLASFGAIEQLAFIPSDFDAAIDYWTKVMGVGPFFMFEDITLDDMRYMGEPTDARFSVAIGYWGDMQIELFRLGNDSPSHVTGKYGVKDQLHHTLFLTEDFAGCEKAVADAGGQVIVSGGFGGGKVMYVDMGQGPGHLVEILQPGEGMDGLFQMMKDAAKDWDGSEPIRTLG